MKLPNYALGLFTGFCLAGLWFLAPAIVESFQTKPAEAAPISQFRVVDTYKGCDVVEWHYGMLAEYRYFLDCTNELLMGMPYGGTSIKARKEKYD
jgi:hypothetical protein